MKTNRRLTLIGLMMATAQVFITVMVIQWLAMQYREEQKLLSENIERAWEEANHQMLDSMLMKRYINPAFDTAEKTQVRLKFDHLKGIPPAGGGKKIFVHISDSVRDTVSMRSESFNAKEIVLRGVKLFVDVQEGDSGNISHAMNLEMPDTSVLKKTFRNQLLLIDPRFRISWDTTSVVLAETAKKTGKVEYKYTLQINDNGIKADVEGSQKVIFMEILPGGLFGLLVILLTSVAFIISYRSLKSQMLLNSQRNDFIRNMSHELRTPVSTVKVALEALTNFDRSGDKDIMKEYLHMAMAETGRLEMLISRVTDLMSEGNMQMMLKQENIRHLIDEVVNTMNPRLETENASVKVIHKVNHDSKNVEPFIDINSHGSIQSLYGVPLIATVDSLHLKGVLINLIDNSLKYSDPPAEIEITTEVWNDNIDITVGDRGQGIPAEYASRIFEKFFRVPKGDVHNIKGYGLGLAYAKMVMKQHGGGIEFQPREGGGSLFLIRLKANTSMHCASSVTEAPKG